ncbi:two component transcriptional regulator, AraC family [Gracilibacillus orientalis]|uniref:Two component transcriptional regulator, AraC family n=1 Tax=Gracilibacillus orientalis TaxID=334253 RepID=A0A1I4LPU8_9BACI|nr:response regulator transcription factor [Gracilibacillus orientalis]SFL93034.1 two component transcriptional regulator, AraC family [Gracilibacillus orientalis]
MIKVMLVDDEAIEREGIRMILSRNRSNAEIVAEAKNGNEAVELATLHHPDIIFMDIKMPEFDGLVAIEKILQTLPETKCVMVSAFDTFQYAKRAMKFGIKEYLLKPSKISEILEAYDRMVAELSEQNDVNERLEQANSLVEMDFILTLMMDHVHEFNTEDWTKWLDVEDTKGFAAVFSFQAEILRPDREQKGNWYRTLKDGLSRLPYHAFVGPLTGYQVPILVKYEAYTLDQFARDAIQDVQRDLHDCQLYVGIGAIITDLQDFSRSYQEALYALEQVQSHPGAKYQVFNEQMAEKRKERIHFEEEKELLHAIKKGDSQQGTYLFGRYFQSIQQHANYQVPIIQKTVENFFIVLTRMTKELGLDQDIQMGFDQFETATQIKEAAKAHLQSVIKQIRDWRSTGVHGLLMQAKDYIESHYQRNITLEEVAEEVGLSSYYLSKLFKEHFEITFIEYVTQTRLTKAKDLLLDDRISLKEIALTIGYKDPNYFSRVFKKETGLSPSEYRKQYS